MPADSDMVMVPREPTEAMLDAFWRQAGESEAMRVRTHHSARHYWRAMLSASPVGEGMGFYGMDCVIREAITDHANGAAAPGTDLAAFITLRLTARTQAAPSTTSTAEQVGTSEASAPVMLCNICDRPVNSGHPVEWCTCQPYMAPAGTHDAPTPGEGEAPVACPTCNGSGTQRVDDLSERGCVGCGGSGLTKDREARRAWVSAAVRPTPATPEGLRPFGLSPLEVERIRSALIEGLDEAYWAGAEVAQGFNAAKEADAILAALQPQAQPAAPESEG